MLQAKPRVALFVTCLVDLYRPSVGFAALKLQLKRAGTPIPLNDVWIAALALQHGATLFTHDRDFENIPQLLRVP
jgi:tRNA(fMet)-specific endonuclease VapC